MAESVRRVYAFFMVDLENWLTYRLDVAFWVLNGLLGALSYAYLGAYAGRSLEYGSYTGFLLVGVAYNSLVYTSMQAPKSALNPWNLEWILMIPARLYEVVLGTSLFKYIVSMAQFLIYMVVALVMGVEFRVCWTSATIVFILGVAAMLGIGLIGAGIQLVTKRFDPAAWLVAMAGGFLSGVWFPVQILPSALREVSKVVPQTYILEALRRSIRAGSDPASIKAYLYPLALITAVTLAAGTLTLALAVWAVKRKGTAWHY